MQINVNADTFFVFDLDDTLYYEEDFLKSAYKHISNKLSVSINRYVYEEMVEKYSARQNAFNWLLTEFGEQLNGVDMMWLLKEYREHQPEISLSKSADNFLKKVKSFSIQAGLITDGRSITQRNKLKALKLENFFSDIIISEEFGFEKPNDKNYTFFEVKYPGKQFYYFGDNTAKDFLAPARLGWNTVCLKSAGRNIHEQKFNLQPNPEHIISSFDEIELCNP